MFLNLRNNFWSRFDVKLTLYYFLVLFAISISICIYSYTFLRNNLMDQVDSLLEDEAKELILEIDHEKDIRLGSSSFQEDIAHRKIFPIFFRVFTAAGTLLFHHDDFPVTTPTAGDTKFYSIADNANANKSYRFIEGYHQGPGGAAFIFQIATDIEKTNAVMKNYYSNIMAVFPALLLISLLLGILISQNPRRIIRSIIDVTQKISSENLMQRLPLPASRDEIYELTTTINGMMDRLEDAFSSLKQFTADFAHELRNPLAALKGEIEVALSRERSAAEYKESLYNCLDRINWLIKMCQDLLLVSRFDWDEDIADRNWIDLKRILLEMHEFFMPMAESKNIRFTIDRCEDAVVYGDKSLLYRLVNNLIENAIKFTPEYGSIAMSLLVRNQEAQIGVSDSGIGVPEPEREKIFQRFYRIDKARNSEKPGTGLGLHICKRIAEAHAGLILVEQSASGGASFIVRMPVVK